MDGRIWSCEVRQHGGGGFDAGFDVVRVEVELFGSYAAGEGVCSGCGCHWVGHEVVGKLVGVHGRHILGDLALGHVDGNGAGGIGESTHL